MLQNFVVPRLNELNYNPRNIVFQQDGAPAHYARIVTDWLDENIPVWIGRGGDIRWPPRSPDLTPLDFFIWPFVKNLVYQNQPVDREDLQDKIIDAFAAIM
jgi:hypothetical protein